MNKAIKVLVRILVSAVVAFGVLYIGNGIVCHGFLNAHASGSIDLRPRGDALDLDACFLTNNEFLLLWLTPIVTFIVIYFFTGRKRT